MILPSPDYRGKVRDIYYIDADRMLLVASDRISAFDVIFAERIAGKGEALTAISCAWFKALRQSPLPESLDFQDHLITDRLEDFPEPFCQEEALRGQSVLVQRCQRIDFECIVRGYLAGSAYKEYRRSGKFLDHSLPAGLGAGDRLPVPIFTPTTKADNGHDLPIERRAMQKELGPLAERLETISLAIFDFAAGKLARQGLLLLDTKFEFGLLGEKIVLIDEILTPDSSRLREADDSSTNPLSSKLDKQFLRHYLEGLNWNKEPPPPPLPPEIVEETRQLYQHARKRIIAALS
ncbi:MAG: phosphoribosylaminoimidazolesuccinocarboxamide synthase [Spirochaetales bacterium]|nr:phosphoribosylaminoimidazolesuccinocarboxamide synthase [Spirochaetales bacterium]